MEVKKEREFDQEPRIEIVGRSSNFWDQTNWNTVVRLNLEEAAILNEGFRWVDKDNVEWSYLPFIVKRIGKELYELIMVKETPEQVRKFFRLDETGTDAADS